MPLTSTPRPHVSFPTRHLERAIDFYSALFNMPPTKRKTDYAKFSCEAPSLNFSLTSTTAEVPATHAHYGVEVANAEAVIAFRARLVAAGLEVGAVEKPTCCYSAQTKFWVADPDGNSWEVFSVQGDTEEFGEHRGPSRASDAPETRSCCAPDCCT